MRLTSLIIAICLAAAPALAAPGYVRVAESESGGTGLVPLENVFAMLRRQYSGDKLDARIRQGANTTYYEVHWLTAEGRKLVFLVNAYTGRIEETRGSDGR